MEKNKYYPLQDQRNNKKTYNYNNNNSKKYYYNDKNKNNFVQPPPQSLYTNPNYPNNNPIYPHNNYAPLNQFNHQQFINPNNEQSQKFSNHNFNQNLISNYDYKNSNSKTNITSNTNSNENSNSTSTLPTANNNNITNITPNNNNFNHYKTTNNNNNNNNNNNVNNKDIYNNKLSPPNDYYRPTFFNRLFGLPSNDKISLLKFKLKLIKIVLICLTMVLITIGYSIIGFTFRTTKIEMKYQIKSYLPSVGIWLDENQLSTTSFSFKKSNTVLNSYDEIQFESLIFNGTTYSVQGEYSDCFSYSQNFFYIHSDCIPSKNNDIFHFTFFLNDLSSFPIYVLIDEEFISTSSDYQSMIGITKSISNYGFDENEQYKLSLAMSKPQVLIDTIFDKVSKKVIQYGLFYTSNVVFVETTQSNFQVILGILSGIGSSITLVILGYNVLMTFIIKLLCDDPSSWCDDEVRECIIYHSDQINLKNIGIRNFKRNTIHIESDVFENLKSNETIAIKDEIKEEIYNETNDDSYDDENNEDGINDNQVEFENDGEENIIYEQDHLSDSEDEEHGDLNNIKLDNLEEDEDINYGSKNNYFLLKD